MDLGGLTLTDMLAGEGEARPDEETVESLNDAMDETGTISGSIFIVSSSSSLLELICVSSLQDRTFVDLTDVFIWGSNALTYLDVGRFHMMDVMFEFAIAVR